MTGNANIINPKEIRKKFLKKYESDLKKMVTMRCGKMTGEEGGQRQELQLLTAEREEESAVAKSSDLIVERSRLPDFN